MQGQDNTMEGFHMIPSAATLGAVISFLLTFACTSTSSLVVIPQSTKVKIILELPYDGMDMFPSVLVFHVGRVPHI